MSAGRVLRARALNPDGITFGQPFGIDEPEARHFKVLSNMLDDTVDNPDHVFDLQESEENMRWLLNYLHAPIDDSGQFELLGRALEGISMPRLISLLTIVNYLDGDLLIPLARQIIARFEGLTPGEIRVLFDQPAEPIEDELDRVYRKVGRWVNELGELKIVENRLWSPRNHPNFPPEVRYGLEAIWSISEDGLHPDLVEVLHNILINEYTIEIQSDNSYWSYNGDENPPHPTVNKSYYFVDNNDEESDCYYFTGPSVTIDLIYSSAGIWFHGDGSLDTVTWPSTKEVRYTYIPFGETGRTFIDGPMNSIVNEDAPEELESTLNRMQRARDFYKYLKLNILRESDIKHDNPELYADISRWANEKIASEVKASRDAVKALGDDPRYGNIHQYVASPIGYSLMIGGRIGEPDN